MDAKAGVAIHVIGEARNEDVFRPTLSGVLTTEIAVEEAKAATGDVHVYPGAHHVEVLQQGGGILAWGEEDLRATGLHLGEEAAVDVAVEVGSGDG